MQLGRLHEARGRQRVDGEVRRGIHARAVLEVRDPLAQGVEVGDEGIPRVALPFAPAVAGYLQGASVAQDRLGGEGALAQEVADNLRGELGLDEVVDAGALGAGGHRKVPRVQRSQVVGPQEAAVSLCFGPAIAPDAQGGLVPQNRVADQRRLQKQIADHPGRELLLHKVENLPRLRAGSSHEVAGVPRRLVQEARPGDGVVDLGLGAPAGPVLRESGRELRVQLGPGIKRQQLVGHVALRLGDGVVVRQVRAAGHGVRDGLVRFGPRVEVQEGSDDLRVHLAAVVVARQSRGDGRAHLAAGLVVGQLSGHVAGDLRLVPVRDQLPGDERQHLGFGPVLGQVERIDGRRDGGSRLRAACRSRRGRIAVRFDEDRVAQVLQGGGERTRHGQVPQDVRALQKVFGRPAGPGLAVAQGHGQERVRDELVRGGGVAVIQQGRVRVIFALRDAGHQIRGGFRSREVISQGRRDGVVGLLDRVEIAKRGEDPALRGLREQQGVRLRLAVGVAGKGQGPIIVREGDAQGTRGVQVADLICPGLQVEGHVPGPGGGVDQIGRTAECGDLRQDAVDR